MNSATRTMLRKAYLPPTTDTFKPIPHLTALDLTARQFKKAGFSVLPDTEEIHLREDGLVMTCKWQFTSSKFHVDPKYTPLAVIANGNDGHVAFKIGFGTVVAVCTNGMVSAEDIVSRKHTPKWPEDIEDRILNVLDKKGGWYAKLRRLLRKLRRYQPTTPQVHSLLVQAMRGGVIASRDIKKVLDIYDSPTHKEYGSDTLYTLHSAFTEVLKGVNPLRLADKTMELNRLMEVQLAETAVPEAATELVELPVVEQPAPVAECPLLGALAASPDFEVRISKAKTTSH